MLRCGSVPANIRELSWFFPMLDGWEAAESLLMQKGSPGHYLLRTSSSPNQFTLSVRSKDGVKHIAVDVKGESLRFGMVSFDSFQDFTDHFRSQPFVSGNSGQLILLRAPFISPKHTTVLEVPNVHGQMLNNFPDRFDKTGYLTKQGGRVKTWKERWFILEGICLSYFEKMDSSVAKATIDLRNCTGLRRFYLPGVIQGKEFAFELKIPWRDYIMVSDNARDRDSWVEILRHKLAWIKSQRAD